MVDSTQEYANEQPFRNYAHQAIRTGVTNVTKLNPWWVTGFVDAEGSFGIKNIATSTDYKVGLQFKVSQNAPNKHVLQDLVEYFGGGKVNIDNAKTNTLKFQVQDLPSIRDKVSSHFDKYPLVTSKRMDYIDWLKAMDIIVEKQHLTQEGKKTILDLKDKMNNSRSKEERWTFLNDIKDLHVPNPNWLVGFIDGEGSFQFEIAKRVTRNTSYVHTNPTLEIAQSNHDVAILRIIKEYLQSGYLKPKFDTASFMETTGSRHTSRFVTNEESKVLSFIDKYPLVTTKQLDFQDWKKLISMKQEKLYKTEEGYSSMRSIKNAINSGRKFH